MMEEEIAKLKAEAELAALMAVAHIMLLFGWGKETPDEKRERELREQLAQLDRRRPQNASDKGEYVKELFECARERQAKPTDPMKKDVPKIIFQKHGRGWDAKSLQSRMCYQRLNLASIAQKKDEILESKESVRAELDLVVQRRKASAGQSNPILLSEAALTTKELAAMEVLMGLEEYSHDKAS